MDREELREAAVALRRAGRTRRQIAEELGIRGSTRLSEVLAGEPPPEWTRRARAKDDLRERARELRAQGWTYPKIVAELGVSKSSVSLWVRDIDVVPEHLSAVERARRMNEVRWEPHRRRQAAVRKELKLGAEREIGSMSDREILMLGAGLYWAEGAKAKPWNMAEKLHFINSDPGMIKIFMRWLALLGVDPGRLRFRVSIHETADVAAAERYWADVVGVDVAVLGRSTIKRHNPKTTRKNRGAAYVGCLTVYVTRSAELYRKVEGWWSGMVAACTGDEAGSSDISQEPGTLS